MSTIQIANNPDMTIQFAETIKVVDRAKKSYS